MKNAHNTKSGPGRVHLDNVVAGIARRADKIDEPNREAARYKARYQSFKIVGKPHRRG